MSSSLRVWPAVLLAALLVGGAGPDVAPNGSAPAPAPAPAAVPTPGHYDYGRAPTPQEVAGWAISVRPDGQGLPPGKGDV